MEIYCLCVPQSYRVFYFLRSGRFTFICLLRTHTYLYVNWRQNFIKDQFHFFFLMQWGVHWLNGLNYTSLLTKPEYQVIPTSLSWVQKFAFFNSVSFWWAKALLWLRKSQKRDKNLLIRLNKLSKSQAGNCLPVLSESNGNKCYIRAKKIFWKLLPLPHCILRYRLLKQSKSTGME